jgi:hypothetical protein
VAETHSIKEETNPHFLMIYPSRPIRKVDSHTAKYNYYDHEKIIQEDGQIATFLMMNEKDKGWIFCGYEDVHGFRIWNDDDRSRAEQMYLSARKNCVASDILAVGETMFAYEYGCIMSQRGGFLVVKDGRILRSKQTWMS